MIASKPTTGNFSSLTTEWVEYRHGVTYHRLLGPLRYVHGSHEAVVRVTVPAGFITDFASVPWPWIILFPRDAQYTKAAVVHDYLCGLDEFDPALADAIFRAAMSDLGVRPVRRLVMFWAVRLWQAVQFRRCSRDNG